MEEISVELHQKKRTPRLSAPKAFRMPYGNATPTPLFFVCVPFFFFFLHHRRGMCVSCRKETIKCVCPCLAEMTKSEGRLPTDSLPHTLRMYAINRSTWNIFFPPSLCVHVYWNGWLILDWTGKREGLIKHGNECTHTCRIHLQVIQRGPLPFWSPEIKLLLQIEY